jgi:hypothetical protein
MTEAKESYWATDILIEVSDRPELFNALSPKAREFLLHWLPTDRSAKPGTAVTLMEIAATPEVFNALDPELQVALRHWRP